MERKKKKRNNSLVIPFFDTIGEPIRMVLEHLPQIFCVPFEFVQTNDSSIVEEIQVMNRLPGGKRVLCQNSFERV
jgi:hypothetical protein